MKKLLFITMFVFLLGGISVAQAQTSVWMQSGQEYINNPNAGCVNQKQVQSGGNITYTPLEPFSDCDVGEGGYGSFPYYLSTIFKILISFGALSAVVMLVWGGITYIVSDAVDMKGNAKKRIQAALLGLALLAGSYLILNTINPDLLKFNLNVSSLSNNAQQNSNTQVQPEMVSSGTLSTSDKNAIKKAFGRTCVVQSEYLGDYICSGPDILDKYVLFDSKSEHDTKVRAETDKFKEECVKSGVSGEGNITIINREVKTISGDIFSAPNHTALVCANS